jgi:hypothetical protein
MNDNIDIYTVVGAVMILFFILGQGYGIGPLGVISSATGIFAGATGPVVLPGVLLLLLVLSFAFSSNFSFRDLAALLVVFLFIVLVVNI